MRLRGLQDMVNRKTSMELLVNVAQDQKYRQFIFITPQGLRWGYLQCVCVCVCRVLLEQEKRARRSVCITARCSLNHSGTCVHDNIIRSCSSPQHHCGEGGCACHP
eukprot:Opistho-2@72474